MTVNVGYWIVSRLIRRERGLPPGPAAGAAADEATDVANTLKSQSGRGWSYDPEATYVVEDE